MLRFRTVLLVVLTLASCPVGMAASPPAYTMTYHQEGAFSAYRFVTVEIASDGNTRCEMDYAGQRLTSGLKLSPQEVAYYEYQFRKVVALDRKAIELMAVDTGTTTWRITESGHSRELTYIFTLNPWATELSQEMWRFVNRQRAILDLGQADSKKLYHAAYEITDLSRGRTIPRPEDLRAPLLEAMQRWPAPGLSFDHQRGTITNLLIALSHMEPQEQWVGDVMALYAGKSRDTQVTLLRFIADGNFLSNLEVSRKDGRGRLLAPLMIQGLRDLLGDPGLAKSDRDQMTCMELINALGSLRDARALEVLASALEHRRPWEKFGLTNWAARSLSRMGMVGVRVLVDMAASDDEHVRGTAVSELRIAAQIYAFPSSLDSPERTPSTDQIDEVRQLLVERGLGPEGMDSFDLPAEAAKALHASFAEWRLMRTSEFSVLVVTPIRAPFPHRAGPQRCKGDFDGNGLDDIALLVRKDDDVKLVVLRQAAENCWTADGLADFKYQAPAHPGYAEFATYITPVSPVEVRPWPPTEKGNHLELRNTGIEVRQAEGPSIIYYLAEPRPSPVASH